jgi:hypothetical protein
MKQALSIAAVTLVAAFVAGVLFLLPPTVPQEVIERSVIQSRPCWKKLGAFLPHRRSATTWTTSRTGLYADRQASLTFFVLSASQQTPRKKFLLI